MTTNDEDNYNTFVIKWKDSLKSFLNDPVDTRSFCISQHEAREPGQHLVLVTSPLFVTS